MFYEERIIDGVLLCRSAPFGPWRRAITQHADAVNELMKLSPERRKNVFMKFCTLCGTQIPRGQKSETETCSRDGRYIRWAALRAVSALWPS